MVIKIMLILINCEAGGRRRWSPWLTRHCHHYLTSPPDNLTLPQSCIDDYPRQNRVPWLLWPSSNHIQYVNLERPKKSIDTVSSIKVTYSDRSFMLVVGTFSNVFLSLLVSIVLQGYLKLPVQKHEHIQSVDSSGNKCLLSTMLRVRRGRA